MQSEQNQTQRSRGFTLAIGFLMLLSATIMGRDIARPAFGLHSWGQAHTAWLARAHVNYGLAYTKGLHTWAVGDPPPAQPSHYLDHPQLPGLLNAGVMHLFGVKLWAPRLAAMIVTIASLPLLLLLLRRLFNDETAVLATLFYVLFPITGYFFNAGAWMIPVVLGALWCYLSLIGSLGGSADPRGWHIWCLGISLFLMPQLGWQGFFYAFAIGTHYVLHCIRLRRLPGRDLLLVLLICPLLGLTVTFGILLAARGWDYEQLIALYRWRSSLGGGPERTLFRWFGRLLEFGRTNFTDPILVLGAGYGIWSAFSWLSSRRVNAAERIDSSTPRRRFHSFWLFLMPGVFYILTFREAMWVHQYQHRHYSLFFAIAAALGVLQLRDAAIKKNRILADFVLVGCVATVAGFGVAGLNSYYEIEHQAPAKIRMFERLSEKLAPSEALLSYESYVVSDQPAKGFFYRPEIAWYLDREIVVSRSMPEIEAFVASGRSRYYLIYHTDAPLFRQLKQRYQYEYIQGRAGAPNKAPMPSYHIFDLLKPKAGR